MKILEKNIIKKIFPEMKKGIEKFPVTILFSIIIFLMVIVGHEIIENGYTDEKLPFLGEDILTWAKIFSIGIPLSATLELIREKYYVNKNKISFRILSFISTIIFLILFNYWLQISRIDMHINIISAFIIFYISFLLIPMVKNGKNNEKYFQMILINQLITIIYSLIVYLGIIAILGSIDVLIINIPNILYLHSFYFSMLIFGVIFFVSRIKKIEELDDYKILKILEILYCYILIPLISIYTAVLYIYFIKILFTLKIPNGIVSHLVLWYTTFSLFILILITPLVEKNKVFKNFKKYFPIISIPLILLATFSIFERVFQYGVTENRYLIISIIAWLLFNMIFYIIKADVIKVLISFIVIVVMVIYSPLNMVVVGEYSQNKRLEKILIKNNVLVNGKLVKNDKLNNEQKREIMGVIDYFIYNSYTGIKNKKIKINNKVYEDAENLMKEIGAEFDWSYLSEGDAVIPLLELTTNNNKIKNIRGYDNYYAADSYYNGENESNGKYEITITNNKLTIKDKKNNKELLNENIEKLVEEVYKKLKSQNKIPENSNYVTLEEEMLLEKENELVKYKITFERITIRTTEEKISDYSYNIQFSQK